MPHCPGDGRHARPDDFATTKPLPIVAATDLGQTSRREPDAIARPVPAYATTARVYVSEGQDFTVGIQPVPHDGGPIRRVVVSFPSWATIENGMVAQLDAETVLAVWINHLGSLLAGIPPLSKQPPSLWVSRRIGRFV